MAHRAICDSNWYLKSHRPTVDKLVELLARLHEQFRQEMARAARRLH
jgi:hypothetical protein